MSYEVALEQFNGPLDLLLHLIKESKVDIWNIQIEIIAEQYLEYIHKMEEFNLNVASEYLVMASELLEIKSRLLLPHEKEEEEEEIDPKEQLVKRLLEYEQYQKMSENFKQLELIRQEIMTKTPESLKEYTDSDTSLAIDVTLDDLMIAFEKFLERKKLSKPIQTKITKKELSVHEKQEWIRKILKSRRKVDFVELFESFTKEYIVVTFLAILEMARHQELKICQDKMFDTIMIEVV